MLNHFPTNVQEIVKSVKDTVKDREVDTQREIVLELTETFTKTICQADYIPAEAKSNLITDFYLNLSGLNYS